MSATCQQILALIVIPLVIINRGITSYVSHPMDENFTVPAIDDFCLHNFFKDEEIRLSCFVSGMCYINSTPRNEDDVFLNGTVINLFSECVNHTEFNVERQLSILSSFKETVKHISSRSNQIRRIEPGYFCWLSNLESVDLSNNRLTDINSFGFSYGNNCHGSQCEFKIENLTLSNNPIGKLPNNSFCNLKSLIGLRLASCNITSIEPEAFRFLLNLSSVDLSHNLLTLLPANIFFNNKHLKTIILSGNKLVSNVEWMSHSLPTLQILDMSNNQINELVTKNFVFDHMENITDLFLNDNNLTAINNDLPSISNVKMLSLANNKITKFSSETFDKLKSLKNLDLTNNKLTEFSAVNENNILETLSLLNNNLTNFPNISTLLNLTTLNIGKNRLTSIQRLHLVNLTALNDINLSKNNLNTIETGTFDEIYKLGWLNLSANNITKLNKTFAASNILYLDISYNQLSTFSFSEVSSTLKKIMLNNNKLTSLESDDLRFSYRSNSHLHRNWSLTEMDLSNNRFKLIRNLFLPPSVEILTLNRNQISSLTYHKDYISLLEKTEAKLKLVKLENNQLKTVCEQSLLTSSPIVRIAYFLHGNPLLCSCENLWIRKKYSVGNIYGTPTAAILDDYKLSCKLMMLLHSTNDTAKSVALMELDPNQFLCKVENTTHNSCYCDSRHSNDVDTIYKCKIQCPENCQCFFDFSLSVVYIKCSRKQLKTMPRNIEYVKTTTQINLWMDGNNISTLKPAYFDDYSNLVRLYLNQSKIRTILNNTFDRLIQVEIIKLGNNQLHSLPNELFINLKKLREIDLSGNRLTYLNTYILGSLGSLRKLKLHDNRLSRFPVWNLRKLTRLRYVTLHANPWSCNCSFVEMYRDYLQSHSDIVENLYKLFCYEPNGTVAKIPLINFNSSRCYRSVDVIHVFKNSVLVISASVVAAVVCMVVLAGLTFYYRHEMEVLVYSHYGIRIFNRNQNDESKNKLYDAFLSYSSEDEEFLLNEIVPSLERIEKPYRLCIHQRDFPVGTYIHDNIMNAVQSSCRTIIILTKSFVDSTWCRFEFKTAHMQMLHDRCPRVLVVVVGEIPQNLDSEINLYLKTNTYLQWGEKLFWEKLYFAMPDQRVTKPAVCLLPLNITV